MKKLSILLVLCIAILLSCTTAQMNNRSVSKNDSDDEKRGVAYTCKFENGKMVVTTDGEAAGNRNLEKADVFIEKTQYMPIPVDDIDIEKVEEDSSHLKFLEEVLLINLIKETGNWKAGESRRLNVTADRQDNLPEAERIIQLARVRTNPKTIRYAKHLFKRITASELAEGAAVNLHKGVIGTVMSINDNEVLVKFRAESDKAIDGPFGPIMVKDMGDHYIIEVDAKEGRLVRVGPAVGKITNVNDKTFTIDYSHPFGGETLSCDVQVVPVSENMEKQFKIAGDQDSTEDTKESGIRLKNEKPKNPQTTAEKGDLVTVIYTAGLESGEIVQTTLKDIVNDPKIKKIDGFQIQEVYEPVSLVAGEQGEFPGLGEGVEGMQIGTHKKIIVPAAQAFGDRNPSLMRPFERTKIVPTRMTIPAKQYVQQYGGFPVKGKIFPFNPYTRGEILEISEKGALIEISPIDNEIDSDFGLTRMQVKDGGIHIHLTPKLGADFEYENQKGKVAMVDDRFFTVDFNPPLAGENIKVTMQLIALKKASAFKNEKIEWVEAFDKGISAARESKKPVVLVLYADWCGYCKKLMNTTLQDPRIRQMNDDFVWIKVNSDKEKAYKDLYGQKSFPLTVILDEQGEILHRIEGFRPAAEYQAEIKHAMQTRHKEVEKLKAAVLKKLN